MKDYFDGWGRERLGYALLAGGQNAQDTTLEIDGIWGHIPMDVMGARGTILEWEVASELQMRLLLVIEYQYY